MTRDFYGSGYTVPTAAVNFSTTYGKNSGSLGINLTSKTVDAVWVKKAIKPEQLKTAYTPTDFVVLGFAFKFTTMPTGIIRLCTLGGCYVSTYTDGTMYLNGVASQYAIEVGIWNYLELVVSSKDLTASLYMNNNLVAQASGITAPVFDYWTIEARYTTGGADGQTYMCVDDMYLLDGAATDPWGASTPNTARLGKCQVLTRYPTADVAKGFTASTGTSNYACVDEATPTGDMDYVYAQAPEATDLYSNTTTFTTIDDNAVVGVAIIPVIRTVEPDGRSATGVVVSNGVTKEGQVARVKSSLYTSEKSMFEVDPSTGQRWTAAGVAAASFGVRLKTIPNYSIS